MLAELGQFALVLALFIAIAMAGLGLAGAQRGQAAWMAFVRPAAQAQALFVALAFAALAAAFVGDDFSVANVAAHSNSELPWRYKLAASWGSHEGSMLLWEFMLAGWTLAVSLLARRLPAALVARVLGVMGLLSIGFLLFILLTSNPFDPLRPAALDGRDLNPLLQDAGMVIHPPMLYMGYVGFAVAFAFAVAALLSGRFDADWARWTRPWTLAAWASLTLGIALGSAWAYYELGWGGWWFWDPVENASFMPWLLGTALLHSLAVAEKRGAFKAWTVLLAIGAFSLSLLGTFIVRSGVLSSVHAFATDPARGVFILAFLALTIGGSLTLFAWRSATLGFGGRFDMLSRETLLLGNNLLLSVAAGAVLLGTLYPLALDVLGAGKISVGPPYFESVFVPLMAPLVLLMALGPLARWKSAAVAELITPLKVLALAGVALTAAGGVALSRLTAGAALGLFLAGWVLAGTAVLVVRRARSGGLARQPGSFWAVVLAHGGLAIFIVGVTMVRSGEVERDVRLAPGGQVEVAGYRFTLVSLAEVPGPNYTALRARVTAQRGSEPAIELSPEKRVYRVQQMPMTEAAIDVGLTRDLYVSLGERLADGSWTLRVQHKPFVDWIWAGALLMALGGLAAVADRRYRSVPASVPAPAGVTA